MLSPVSFADGIRSKSASTADEEEDKLTRRASANEESGRDATVARNLWLDDSSFVLDSDDEDQNDLEMVMCHGKQFQALLF